MRGSDRIFPGCGRCRGHRGDEPAPAGHRPLGIGRLTLTARREVPSGRSREAWMVAHASKSVTVTLNVTLPADLVAAVDDIVGAEGRNEFAPRSVSGIAAGMPFATDSSASRAPRFPNGTRRNRPQRGCASFGIGPTTGAMTLVSGHDAQGHRGRYDGPDRCRLTARQRRSMDCRQAFFRGDPARVGRHGCSVRFRIQPGARS